MQQGIRCEPLAASLAEYDYSRLLATRLPTAISCTILAKTTNTRIPHITQKVPFKRPSNLAEDDTPTLPVIKHTLEFYKAKGEEFDAVCLLQVTSPFRTVAFLNNAIYKFIKSNTDSLISVLEVPHEYNPHWSFEENSKGNLSIATGENQIITRRQELPKAYHRDGSLYLTKVNVILEQNSLYGNSISYIESKRESYVNIDVENDWKLAEKIAKKMGY